MKCVRCTKEAKSFPCKDGICEECSNEIYLGQEPIQIEQRLEQEVDVLNKLLSKKERLK